MLLYVDDGQLVEEKERGGQQEGQIYLVIEITTPPLSKPQIEGREVDYSRLIPEEGPL